MKQLGARIADFWIAPSTAASLGIHRLVFFGFVFILYSNRDFSIWAGYSEFWQPVWYLKAFGVDLPASMVLIGAQIAWRIALLLSCIGLLTRASTAVAAILGWYLLGIQHSFGFIPHNHNLTAIGLAIFALASSGDGFSVDEWIRSRRSPGEASDQAASGKYTWPIRLFWFVWCVVFFAAGAAKLRNSGLDWVLSDTVSNYLLIHSHIYREYVASSGNPRLDLLLSQQKALCKILAGTMLAMELIAPLALASIPMRFIIVGSLGIAQIVIAFVLVDFRWYIPFYLMWIPWGSVIKACDAAFRKAAAGWLRADGRSRIAR